MDLYDALVPWYPLLDPVADHADEARAFTDMLERFVHPRPETLLELGSGAGHNAFHLAARFRLTLSDVSPAMLARSRGLVPSAEHVVGDMRTLRLGRTFDAVLVHDAIVYMTTRAELRAALTTAYVHLRPGGAAIVAPDATLETLATEAHVLACDDGPRALRGLEWTRDVDPHDERCTVDWVLLLAEGERVTSFHEQHVEGVFTRATWLALLAEVGFEVHEVPRPIGDGATDLVFVGVRRG